MLKVPGGKLTAARLGEGSGLEQGETVVALGFPAGATPEDSPTSTRGVVSAPRTTLREPSPDVPAYRGAVQTDTALNPGFSGGPLADRDGRVVGINAAARTMGADGRSLEGQNFAIGIDRARPVLDRLRQRPVRGVDRRDVRLPDDRGARRSQAPARAVHHRRDPGEPGRGGGRGRARRGAGGHRRPPRGDDAPVLLRRDGGASGAARR